MCGNVFSQGELLFLQCVVIAFFSGRVIASLRCVEIAFLLGWLLLFTVCETAFLQGVMLRSSVRPSC